MLKLKQLFFIVCLFLLITPFYPARASEISAKESFLVKSKNTISTETDLKSLGIAEFKKINNLNFYEIETTPENISLLAEKDSTEFIEKNNKVRISQTPNDPYFSNQTYLQDSNIINAWNVTSGSPNIIVAVIDTGVDYNHEDLKNKIWTGANGYHGYDFVNSDTDPMDDNGHGTMVAGIIAAEKNNGIGIAGIANVKIMAIKSVPESGEGDVADLARGIVYAADNGARVANVSLGLAEESTVLDEAIDYAKEKNCLIVAANGNAYRPFIDNPARNPDAIGVSAVNANDVHASYANYGFGTTISALGNNIYSTSWNTINASNLYAYENGTSFAAPQVTAAVALLLSMDSSLTPGQLKKRIESSAKKILFMTDLNYDEEYGYGKLDALSALKYDVFPPEANLNIYKDAYGIYNIKGQIMDDKNSTNTDVSTDIPDSNIGLVRYQAGPSGSWTILNNNPVESLNVDFNLSFLSTENQVINFEINDTAGNKKTVSLSTANAVLSAPISHNLNDYQSELVDQSAYVNASPNQTTNMNLVFKNTGNTVWNKNTVHLGTTHPMDNPSAFADSSWLSNNRISMQEDSVPINGLAHFNFTITAPNGLYGSFNQYFNLVAEGIGWLKDMGIYWKINITQPSYHATFIDQSPYITMNVNEEKPFWVEFQNSGSAAWNSSNVSLGTSKPQDRSSSFYDSAANSGWKSDNRISMSQATVAPGETVKFNFTAKAPPAPGVYYENFRPVADGVTWMEDYGLFWKITVN